MAITAEESFHRDAEGDPVVAAGPPGSEAFPVGAVFIAVVSTSPATLLGYGTWAAFGAGRVLIGLNSGDTDFDAAEETGGAKTVAAAGTNSAPTISGSTANESAHTHTYTQVVNHTHGFTDLRGATTGGATTNYSGIVAGADSSSTATPVLTANPGGGVATGTTEAGTAHSHSAGTLAASAPTFTGSPTSVVQPYIVVYMWKRTA